jgi:hypothetical protein
MKSKHLWGHSCEGRMRIRSVRRSFLFTHFQPLPVKKKIRMPNARPAPIVTYADLNHHCRVQFGTDDPELH